MPIPDTVRTAVITRLRLMSRRERSALMCASLVGPRFDVAFLAIATAYSEEQIRAALERARALQLVDTEEAGHERYFFRHGLTRDIICEEMFAARARPVHRRIARALERVCVPGIEPLEDLAYHTWAAGDVRRGLRYNELAGDRAAGVHATNDARTYYSRARSLTAVASAAYERLTAKLIAAQGGEAPNAP